MEKKEDDKSWWIITKEETKDPWLKAIQQKYNVQVASIPSLSQEKEEEEQEQPKIYDWPYEEEDRDAHTRLRLYKTKIQRNTPRSYYKPNLRREEVDVNYQPYPSPDPDYQPDAFWNVFNRPVPQRRVFNEEWREYRQMYLPPQ